MKEIPVDRDRPRGMAARKATDLRRAIAVVEAHVRELRARESDLENRVMAVRGKSSAR